MAIVAALAMSAGSVLLQTATKEATYAENQCRPAARGWQRRGSEFGELMTVNLLEVRHNRLVWNGTAVTRRRLQTYLAESRSLSPVPNLALLRANAAAKYLGISRSAFYRLIADERLPRPIPLTADIYFSGAKGYPQPWLDAVIAARATRCRW